MSHDPSRDVRMLRSSTLILRLLDSFQHGEPSIARTRSKKSPYTGSEIENVQRDQMRPCADILLVWLQEVRKHDTPLSGSQSDKQVGKGNLPNRPAAQTTNVVIQARMPFLVVTTAKLDTHEVC